MKNSVKIIIKTLKFYPNLEAQSVRYQKKRKLKYNRLRFVSFFQKDKMDKSFSLHEKTLFEHAAIEKFSLIRLKALQWYFLDALETWDLDDETRYFFEQNYKRILIILNGNKGNYFCDFEYVYVVMFYKTVKDTGVGQLYAQRSFSCAYFPQELRAMLIPNKYKEFGIFNASPTLLLKYAKSHMKFHPKNLYSYVINRDEFISEITQKFDCSKDFIEKILLQALNSTRDDISLITSDLENSDFAKFLIDFFLEEIILIREDIYQKSLTKDSIIAKYLESRKEFHYENIEKQKLIVQSLYLQSEKTAYVYRLIRDLEQKIVKYIQQDERNLGWHSQFIDQSVDLDEREFFLSCIPMHGGVLIGSEDDTTKRDLENMVAEHNKKLSEKDSFVQFECKQLDRSVHKIDIELCILYLEVFEFIQTLNTRKMTTIIKLLNIKPLSFDDCESFNDMSCKVNEFRRTLIKALIEFQESHKVPFNENFLPKLNEIYKERRQNDVDFNTLFNELEDEFVASEDEAVNFVHAFENVTRKELHSESGEEERVSSLFQDFSDICERVSQIDDESAYQNFNDLNFYENDNYTDDDTKG